MRKKKRNTKEVNTGSMADIAFLLLVFFLVTTSLDQDYGISSNISKPFEVPDSVTLATNTVVLNNEGQFMINNVRCPRGTLVSALNEVLSKEIGIKNAILVKTEREVDYDLFIYTINEVKRSFHVHYNELAVSSFNKEFDELSAVNKSYLMQSHPVVLAEEILEL